MGGRQAGVVEGAVDEGQVGVVLVVVVVVVVGSAVVAGDELQAVFRVEVEALDMGRNWTASRGQVRHERQRVQWVRATVRWRQTGGVGASLCLPSWPSSTLMR